VLQSPREVCLSTVAGACRAPGGGLADDLSAVAACNTAARRHGAAASRPESGAGCMHGEWHSTKSWCEVQQGLRQENCLGRRWGPYGRTYSSTLQYTARGTVIGGQETHKMCLQADRDKTGALRHMNKNISDRGAL